MRGGDQPDGRQRAGAEQVQRPHRVRAAQQQLVKVKAQGLIHLWLLGLKAFALISFSYQG